MGVGLWAQDAAATLPAEDIHDLGRVSLLS